MPGEESLLANSEISLSLGFPLFQSPAPLHILFPRPLASFSLALRTSVVGYTEEEESFSSFLSGSRIMSGFFAGGIDRYRAGLREQRDASLAVVCKPDSPSETE